MFEAVRRGSYCLQQLSPSSSSTPFFAVFPSFNQKGRREEGDGGGLVRFGFNVFLALLLLGGKVYEVRAGNNGSGDDELVQLCWRWRRVGANRVGLNRKWGGKLVSCQNIS